MPAVDSRMRGETGVSLFMVYADESHNDRKFCLSAIVVRHRDWMPALVQVKAHRAGMGRTAEFEASRSDSLS